MAETKRNGVFIGAYVPKELKDSLNRRAKSNHRTLSQEITKLLYEAAYGANAQMPGGFDRRSRNSAPRRRDVDPFPRRRKDDYTPPDIDPLTGEKK